MSAGRAGSWWWRNRGQQTGQQAKFDQALVELREQAREIRRLQTKLAETTRELGLMSRLHNEEQARAMKAERRLEEVADGIATAQILADPELSWAVWRLRQTTDLTVDDIAGGKE